MQFQLLQTKFLLTQSALKPKRIVGEDNRSKMLIISWTTSFEMIEYLISISKYFQLFNIENIK